MPLLTVQPTDLDERIAHQFASHTDRTIQRVASAATWGADEHVLLAIAAIGWLMSKTSSDRERRLGNHFLACSLTTTIVPYMYIMKHFIDQARPDRLTIIGHMKGVPLSGRAEDAFPSGHALHIGALASAATLLAPKWRPAIWGGGAFLVGTRVVLLAHWFTDILAGLAIGVGIERRPRAGR